MTVNQFMPPNAGLMRKLGGGPGTAAGAPGLPLFCSAASACGAYADAAEASFAAVEGAGAAMAESGGPYCSGAAAGVGVYVNCGAE